MKMTTVSRFARATRRSIAPLLLSAAAACGGGREADPDGPPPSRPMEAGPTTDLPPIPDGSIPRKLVYSARRYQADRTFAEGWSVVRVDHRDLPGQPQWRLSTDTPQYGYATAAHLTSDLELVWLEDTWRGLVRLRRTGDQLIGEREVIGGRDSLRIALAPGAPFHTDLSLHFLLATWPLAAGWEERGMMSDGRHPDRVVPVRIRVVGEEILSTRLGTVDCWIVVVHGPRDSQRAPQWYWASKRDRMVIMRRQYLPEHLGAFDEYLIHEYPARPQVLIDVVVVEAPALDAAPVVRFERAVAPTYHLAANGLQDDTLYRFTLSAEPPRDLTSSDSGAIVRLLESAGYGGRYRIEPPTDRAFVRVPRGGSDN